MKVMKLFARPAVDDNTWWADLKPHLSEQAQSDYYGVDPVNVPVTHVTGDGKLVDTIDSPLVAIVHIPTDAGLYAITLSRSPEAPQWVVERITPPEPDPH